MAQTYNQGAYFTIIWSENGVWRTSKELADIYKQPVEVGPTSMIDARSTNSSNCRESKLTPRAKMCSNGTARSRLSCVASRDSRYPECWRRRVIIYSPIALTKAVHSSSRSTYPRTFPLKPLRYVLSLPSVEMAMLTASITHNCWSKVTFLTKIYHPGINEEGSICVPILHDQVCFGVPCPIWIAHLIYPQWKPSITLSTGDCDIQISLSSVLKYISSIGSYTGEGE